MWPFVEVRSCIDPDIVVAAAADGEMSEDCEAAVAAVA